MRTPRIALALAACLVIGPPGAPAQDIVESGLTLISADGTTHALSERAARVDGESCLPLPDLATALHGTPALAPSLSLRGASLYTIAGRVGERPRGAVLGVARSGRVSSRVRTVEVAGKPVRCVPAIDLAKALGGRLNGSSIEGFDEQVDSMLDNNLIFLALQTKVQSVAQTTQMMSNIAKTDSDAKLNAIRNMRTSVFEENETALYALPAEQAAWVESYARRPGRDIGAPRIQAAIRDAFPDASPKEMVKIHMILLHVMMGDVAGALRSYAVLMDRDFRSFSGDLVGKLEQVRRARARVIRNFAAEKPPRAYAGEDPRAARAQDKAQRYTQFVQLSTQLVSELATTERELVDALQTMNRDLDELWQAYASLRDEKFRTDNRIMRIQ